MLPLHKNSKNFLSPFSKALVIPVFLLLNLIITCFTTCNFTNNEILLYVLPTKKAFYKKLLNLQLEKALRYRTAPLVHSWGLFCSFNLFSGVLNQSPILSMKKRTFSIAPSPKTFNY